MAYFDELLQRAITVRNNRAPASNTADLVGGVLVGIVTALQMLLDDKQDELTFDTAPTADSQNPVTSDGIYQALQAIDLSACEKIVNKVTSISAQSTNVQYPTAKLLYDSLQALSGIYAAIVHTHAIADIINLQTELDARQLVSNLVTAITAQSTDVQYPSAKLLYDQLQGLAAVYAPKVHTHPYADIERPANVASVNAQGYTITTAYYSHVLTITADATLHLPTMQSGAAIILRLTIIQDATGGRAVTFDGGAALVFNPYQTDLSLGQANYRCWVVLWFDGVNWAWLASPYVLRAESQFAYTIDGTTGGQYVTITINGTTMQIQATSGVWQYGYNNPINSIAFTGDTGVLNVDFTNSDGLANITTLADAFKNCAALVAVDFTGCDLSNVATAADCFAGCTSLAALTIPTGTWKPDIDLSACAAFTKAAMLAVIDGLYTYASGTHTVTFNTTAWDALSQADQQQVYNAADAKGWTTNAVAVSYVVSGTSSNVNGTETFIVRFIQNGAQQPGANETITCNVDANGDWSFEYQNKKIYSLADFATNNTTVITIDFSNADDFSELYRLGNTNTGLSLGATQLTTITFGNGHIYGKLANVQNAFSNSHLTTVDIENINFNNVIVAQSAFNNASALTSLNFGNSATFASLENAYQMFRNCSALTSISMPNATFESVTDARAMFYNCNLLTTITWAATFTALQTCGGISQGFFQECRSLTSINLDSCVFANVTNIRNMFNNCRAITAISIPNATFEAVTDVTQMFYVCSSLVTIDLPKATFASATTITYWLNSASAVKTINLPKATFANLPNGTGMFGEMPNLESVIISEATFAAMTATSDSNANGMFRNTPKLTAVSMPEAIFGEVAHARQMFQGCGVNGIKIDMPKATFAKCTNAFRMFNRFGRAYGNIAEINMPLATFDLLPTGTSLDGAIEMFGQNSNLTKLTVPNSSTLDAAISLSDAPLGYNSLLAVANWLKDLTGGTAKTVTFKTSAWNALTTAEQTTIDNILSGKNWTRVLA